MNGGLGVAVARLDRVIVAALPQYDIIVLPEFRGDAVRWGSVAAQQHRLRQGVISKDQTCAILSPSDLPRESCGVTLSCFALLPSDWNTMAVILALSSRNKHSE